MAFRTNKMPVLQEKSASGAVASFNTALAMPLVECKTEFMCTQGAGTPSPSNPLAITGVDDITITANGNSIVIDLDGTRYGGYVDVVRKKLILSDIKAVFDGSENWGDYSGRGGWQISTTQSTYPYSAMKSGNYLNGFCNWLPNALTTTDTGVRRGANNQVIYIQYVKTLI